MSSIDAPQRAARPQQRRALLKLARKTARTDKPTHLDRHEINEAPSLFQPRFDSIAFAPGRSETHVEHLARKLRNGATLDPVKVVAFGPDWYLVDGHHRLEAYAVAEWTKPIPVDVRHSELEGDARINWAIQESVEDNKKERLAMSDVDKMDAAWASVARGDELSISETATIYDVSPRTVANMRKAEKALRAAEVRYFDQIVSWQRAKMEVQSLEDAEGPSRDFDYEAKRRREAARRLKGAMQMNLPAHVLAEVLESYSPGIVETMAMALKLERDEGGDGLEGVDDF